MTHDVKCPYCEKGQKIDHDDDYGYQENEMYEQACRDCGKSFGYNTGILYVHETWKAPCLNGGSHDLQKVGSFQNSFPDRVECKNCDFEDKGKEREEWRQEYIELMINMGAKI